MGGVIACRVCGLLIELLAMIVARDICGLGFGLFRFTWVGHCCLLDG